MRAVVICVGPNITPGQLDDIWNEIILCGKRVSFDCHIYQANFRAINLRFGVSSSISLFVAISQEQFNVHVRPGVIELKADKNPRSKYDLE